MATRILPTPEELRQLLDYNPETGVLTWRARNFTRRSRAWSEKWAGRQAGALGSHGYIQIGIGGRLHKAHRLAWVIFYGKWPDGVIDHINGIRTDNRISNLRDVRREDNNKNSAKQAKSGGGCAGVYWVGRLEKWRAQITSGGRQQYLGMFETRFDATLVRLNAEKKLGFSSRHGLHR